MSFSAPNRSRHWVASVTLSAAALGSAGLVGCVPLRSLSSDGVVLAGSPARRGAPVTDLATVLRDAEGTYIARMLVDRDSTLERWRERDSKPIRVWIESLGGDERDFPVYMRSAFQEWEAVGLPLRFAFVTKPADAEVTVRWTPQLVNKTGNTVWRVDHRGWMESANVLIATHLANGRRLDPSSLRAIALHEIGHLLGLSHSENSHDVMAPLVRVAALSASDRATARLLYALPAGRVR